MSANDYSQPHKHRLQTVTQLPRLLGHLFSNRELARSQVAFVAFNIAEWSIWITMLVYAFQRGGVTEEGIVALIQLIPAALFGPFLAVLADRFPPARVLKTGYFAQATAITATGFAVWAKMPILAYAAATLATTLITITRPTQWTLVPALARSPDELTAANVLEAWIEALSILIASAGVGVILAVAGPREVLLSVAGVVTLAGLAVLPVRGPSGAAAAGGVVDELMGGFRALRARETSRVLLGITASQYLITGALTVLFVVLAVDGLGYSRSWAGYLNVAYGAGGAAIVVFTVGLVGRKLIGRILLVAVVIWAGAFALLALKTVTWTVIAALFVVGASRSVFDVSGRTLLQRATPSDVVSRIFGILEGVAMAAVAVGAISISVIVNVAGLKSAVLVLAGVLALIAVFAAPLVLSAEREANVPITEINLLRVLPLFTALRPPQLETLARQLQPVEVESGTTLIRKGDPGDRFYVIASGTFEIRDSPNAGKRLGRGDYFGEIALLAHVPRTATVVAIEPALIYGLDKAAFLGAVTHPGIAGEAERMLHARMH